MKSKFINVLMFAAGAAIGSAVTWKIVKDRYERIVQEELASIQEAFSSSESKDDQEQSESTEDDEEGQKECSGQINWDELEDLDEEEYEPTEADKKEHAALTNRYINEKGGAVGMPEKPYVISPYDFGEIDEYSQIELTYYADGTLEDDEGNIVTDGDELIGEDSLNTFGEYEDDAVFVRNERLMTDFQILKDYRTYEEARSVGPNQVDDE